MSSFLILPYIEHDDSHKYAICCNHGNDRLFLFIDNDLNEVIACKLNDLRRINFFSLRCTEIRGEFIIMDYAETDVKTEALLPPLKYDFWPTPRYLRVNTHLGYNSGPLRMKDSVDEYHCRLTLRPRLFREHSHVTMNDFTNGKDMFYIRTSRRRGRTGYLYVKDRGEGAETMQPNKTVQPNKTIQPNVTEPAKGAERIEANGGVESDCMREERPGLIPKGPENLEMQKIQTNRAETAVLNDRGKGTEPIQPNSEETPQAELTDNRVTAEHSPPTRYRYITTCKPSIKGGNSDELMLFRLVRYENMYALDQQKESMHVP